MEIAHTEEDESDEESSVQNWYFEDACKLNLNSISPNKKSS
jgi:hypothetical protein